MSSDPWVILESGRHDEAMCEFARLVAEQPESPSPLDFSMACARLYLHDAETALASFDGILHNARFVGTGHYAMSGIARWYLDRRHGAVALWKKGMGAQYADAAGGMELPLLLYYAAVKDPSVITLAEAKGLVEKATRHPWAKCWPGPLGLFVLGEVSDDAVRKAALFKNAIVTNRQMAQVEFWVGIKALEAGDVEAFQRQMKICVDTPRWHIAREFYVSRFEARQLGLVAPQ